MISVSSEETIIIAFPSATNLFMIAYISAFAPTSIPRVGSFMAATIGVGLYSKMEIVSTICMFLARGAIISMLVIIILLPAILSVTFPFIKKTTKNLV